MECVGIFGKLLVDRSDSVGIRITADPIDLTMDEALSIALDEVAMIGMMMLSALEVF